MEQKTTLYLPQELQQQLKGLARRKGTSQAHIIREALAAYLAEEEEVLPKSIGVVSRGTVSGSEAKEWAREELRRKWSR